MVSAPTIRKCLCVLLLVIAFRVSNYFSSMCKKPVWLLNHVNRNRSFASAIIFCYHENVGDNWCLL